MQQARPSVRFALSTPFGPPHALAPLPFAPLGSSPTPALRLAAITSPSAFSVSAFAIPASISDVSGLSTLASPPVC